jgi:outer membrane protein assembly factor BamB
MIISEEIGSRWPCGSGVIVRDGVAYFSTGLFPSQNTYVFALDAATGALNWSKTLNERDVGVTDAVGAVSGFVANGPMALSGSSLHFTTGIGTPWTIDLNDPQHKPKLFTAANAASFKKVSEIMPVGEKCFVSSPALEIVHHAQYKSTSSARSLPILADNAVYRVQSAATADCGLISLATSDDITSVKTADGNKPVPSNWRAWKNVRMNVLIEAAGTLYSGGEGKVYATDRAKGTELWSVPVAGAVADLAACAGTLLVLTSGGEVVCFGE